MANELAVNGEVSSALLADERRVRNATLKVNEDWFKLGDAIAQLHDNGNWGDEFDNWTAYLKARSEAAFGLQRRQCHTLFVAAKTLPDLYDAGAPGRPEPLPIKVVEQLGREYKNHDTGQVVRLQKRTKQRIAKAYQAGGMTVADVKAEVDKALGKTRKDKERAGAALDDEPLPEEALEDLRFKLAADLRFFKQNPAIVQDAKQGSPEVVKRLTKVLKDFASFLDAT